MAIKLPLAELSFSADFFQKTSVIARNGTESLVPVVETIFSASSLNPGTHSLTIQLTNNGNFTLDSFNILEDSTNNTQVISGSVPTNTQAVSPSGGGEATQSASQSSIPITSGSQAPKSALPNTSSSSRTNIGLIIGACVGAAAFGVLVTIAMFLFLRRLKLRRRLLDIYSDSSVILSDGTS